MNRKLNALEESLGLDLPAEFRSLYTAFDGVGVAYQDAPGGAWWLFRPIDQIEAFCDQVRQWFQETHDQYALRFFPFIDFANGDGVGYVTDESGKPMEGLFYFEHESYEFDEDQDANEFLSQLPVSIEGFLTQV